MKEKDLKEKAEAKWPLYTDPELTKYNTEVTEERERYCEVGKLFIEDITVLEQRIKTLEHHLWQFITMHETGLLPNRFTYQDAKIVLPNKPK